MNYVKCNKLYISNKGDQITQLNKYDHILAVIEIADFSSLVGVLYIVYCVLFSHIARNIELMLLWVHLICIFYSLYTHCTRFACILSFAGHLYLPNSLVVFLIQIKF